MRGAMMDCLFCKIVEGEIPANYVYQDDEIIAINDINPQAPEHKLIIPRKHISTLNDLAAEDSLLIGNMVQVARRLALQLGVSEAGYRLVVNCNKESGQTVFHIHMHLLGGRTMHWPPG
jgi:histidine triad (HIT) family protein